ncbi:hypothetical protein ACWEPB_04440 [Kitasatospora cineracea]
MASPAPPVGPDGGRALEVAGSVVDLLLGPRHVAGDALPLGRPGEPRP